MRTLEIVGPLAILAAFVPAAASAWGPLPEETVILADPANDLPSLSGFDITALAARQDDEGLHLTLHLSGDIPPPATKTDYKVFWRTNGREPYRNVGASINADGSTECDRTPNCEIDLANGQVRYHIPFEAEWSTGCVLLVCTAEPFFPSGSLREFAVEVWQVDTGGDICYDRAPGELGPFACPGREGPREGSFEIVLPEARPFLATIEATPGEWIHDGFAYTIDVAVRNAGTDVAELVKLDPVSPSLSQARIAFFAPGATENVVMTWRSDEAPTATRVDITALACATCDDGRESRGQFVVPAAIGESSEPIPLGPAMALIALAIVACARSRGRS